MEKAQILECVNFFNNITIVERDISTPIEIQNHQKVVEVDYLYQGAKYTTNKLFYKNILFQSSVKNAQNIYKYFGEDVYWLDINMHDWPKDSSEAELERVIIDEMTGEEPFKVFLRRLANNHKTGFIQKLLAEGKTGQYHHNFENNNHWHDIILLIKKIIKSKGKKIDKKYFSRLVFRWDGDKNTVRARSSLAKEVEGKSRAFIDALYKNIQSIQIIIADMEIIEILKQKKQIILQGPPGTGKTREAKEIATILIAENIKDISTISKEDILQMLTVSSEIKTVAGGAKYIVEALDNEKVSLSRETETTADTTFAKIIEFYRNKRWNDSFTDNDSRRAAALAYYIYQALSSRGNDEQFLRFIQFHPAYSYEDFVRGIVAESKGEVIEYKTKNKILADFAAKALSNYNDSRKNTEQLTVENWIEDNFSEFTDYIADEIEKNNGRLLLDGTTTYLKQIDEDCFRYTGDNWNTSIGNRMHFKDILEMFNQNIKERQEIKKMTGVSGLAKQHASYFMKVLDLFYSFMKDKEKPKNEVNQIKEKNFVLIIDEINRANLPAVLGELIYALEYRGEKVESMYATMEEGNTLILPPNLYIIGTMNTSDRSVGHIDYAIRRRFAFIDVLPKVLEGDKFEFDLFKKVSSLFIQNIEEYVNGTAVELKPSEHLSEEFRPEDVWLGHSYFIKGDTDFSLRKKYEIIPILKEYLKDGILKNTKATENYINSL